VISLPSASGWPGAWYLNLKTTPETFPPGISEIRIASQNVCECMRHFYIAVNTFQEIEKGFSDAHFMEQDFRCRTF
jgi:hypothetical protein